MIEAISNYIRNIAFFLIFISFIGIIIPNTKYKSYINILLGFMLVMIMISPIATLIYNKQNPLDRFLLSVNGATKQTTTDELKEFEILQQDMINKTYKANVVEQINSLIKEESLSISEYEIDFNQNTGQILKLVLNLKETIIVPTPKPFIRIEPFKVEISPQDEDKEEDLQALRVKKIISDFYNMSADNIHISIAKNQRN